MNVILSTNTKKDKAGHHLKGDQKKGGKSYFTEVKEEVMKVSWPQAEELKSCTKVVIGVTFACGFGIYCSDLVIKSILDGIAVLSKLVFG